MTDQQELDEAREALDLSAEAIQVWESEILLRSAAWVAILQGLTGVIASMFRFRSDEQLLGVSLVLPLVGFTAAFPWLRSWFSRAILFLGCVGLCLWLAIAIDPGLSAFWDAGSHAAPLSACLAYSAMGALLLRRNRLARDMLLALAGTWIVALSPEAIGFVTRTPTMSSRELATYFLILALLVPPFFVCATLVSRAGRSLFEPCLRTEPLARLATLRRARGGARAWAAALVIPLTCLGSLVFLRELGLALRRLW